MNTRVPLVQATLDEVAALRLTNYQGSDDTVMRLLDEYGDGSDLAELLWADLPATYCPEDVAVLLNLWAWRTNDNGARIGRTLERWIIDSSDERKVWIALNQEAYPFRDGNIRIGQLLRLKSAFPALEERCDAMIAYSLELLERERLRSAQSASPSLSPAQNAAATKPWWTLGRR
ncbi:hypothetical protein J2W27_000017 [Variovorax boronicumulans]|uniref:hypothetical protein n=1 Tax=Variovorax boronicumulans TaxID=436515 RepID=UPI002783AEAB|nr:hypothetical protein [Variovorax boronicumulans]MDP9907924.1 hypothetical protein [Variovorax boronicumulans]